MPSILPAVAHGDTLPVVKIAPKYEGSGTARHIVGSQLTALLLFDNCAPVPITILGLDASTLPSPETVQERNLNLQFLMGKFQNLVITFSGGDYGAIRYKGTATGLEFVNLSQPQSPSHSNPAK